MISFSSHAHSCGTTCSMVWRRGGRNIRRFGRILCPMRVPTAAPTAAAAAATPTIFCSFRPFSTINIPSRRQKRTKRQRPGMMSSPPRDYDTKWNCRPFPWYCPLCKTQINSIAQLFVHIRTQRHWGKIQELLSTTFLQDGGMMPPLDPLPPPPQSALGIGKLLESHPMLGTLHADLGFDVSQIIAWAPQEERRCVRRQSLYEEASALPADPDWIRVKFRHLLGWNAPKVIEPDTQSLPMNRSPLLADMIKRCEYPMEHPRVISSIPHEFPLTLPRYTEKELKGTNHLKAQHLYPYYATSRIGLAALVRLNLSPQDWDIICPNSFIQVLSGGGKPMGRCFWYLQRLPSVDGRPVGPWFVLSKPNCYYDQDAPGHKVERLLSSSNEATPSSMFSINGMEIGGHRLLVSCEVDAVDEEAKQWIEIKSSKRNLKRAIDVGSLLQVAINGCHMICACTLNDNGTAIESMDWIPAQDMFDSKQDSMVAKGRRVRLLLDKILNHKLLQQPSNSIESGIFRLSFDSAMFPIIKAVSSRNVQVLPEDYAEIFEEIVHER